MTTARLHWLLKQKKSIQFPNFLLFSVVHDKKAGTPEPRGSAPVALIVRGQHGGKKLSFLQELHIKTRVLLK
jgi:hypothetical protein